VLLNKPQIEPINFETKQRVVTMLNVEAALTIEDGPKGCLCLMRYRRRSDRVVMGTMYFTLWEAVIVATKEA
jgi:hypothetical protein